MQKGMLKNKSRILGLLLLFFNITAIAQVPSQNEFIRDFDSLVAIIREMDPRLQSWKDLAGIDILKEIEKQRKYVDTITSTNDFMALINATLQKCLDGHASVVPPAVFQYMLEQLPAPEQQHLSGMIDSMQLQQADRNFNNLVEYQNSLSSDASGRPFRVQHRYINGNYVLTNTFKTEHKVFACGWKVQSLNHIDLYDSLSRILSSGSNMPKFDLNNRRFYSNNYLTNKFLLNDTVYVDFRDENENIKHLTVFPGQKSRLKGIKLVSLYDNAVIKLFRKYNMLYIRLNEMVLNDKFMKKLSHFCRNKKFTLVVINISGNYGGDDAVWQKIMSMFIHDTISYEYRLGFKNSALTRKYLGIGEYQKCLKMQLWTGEEFLAKKYRETIVPSENHVSGSPKIYLIHDENIFSSAGSFRAFSNCSDQITSIGFSTGWMGGFGATPFYFILPETKILIRLDCGIDLTDADSSAKLFQKDEVEVSQTLEWYYNRNVAYDRNSLRRLLTFPPFLKVLQLEGFVN